MAAGLLSIHLILGNLGQSHWWIPLSNPGEQQLTTLTNLDEYQKSLYPIAQDLEKDYGINPAITLAIASHETGNGAAVIGENNHWGIKGNDVTTTTTEYYGGQMVVQDLGFADDKSDILFAQTVENILKEHGRTTEFTKTNPEESLKLIGEVYATDPSWAEKVNSHMEKIK